MKPSSSKQNNLLNFFAKRNPRKVDDDSCEVLFEGPPKKATKWDEYVQKSGGNTSTAEGWENPCNIPVGSKSNDTLTKQALLENGFDETIGNFIYYPIDEIVRPFELNLVRCALSSNVCIALPSTAPSSTPRIMSITVANFLKWFPRSRALLLTYSSTSSAEWVESLKHLGIESSIIPSSSKKKVELNRVIISANPQAVKKFVDAEKEVSEDIRILILELKANECCNKYKPLMNELLVRDIPFRCIVLTTSVLNTSRRTAVITKRQQMITNLQLSDWIEQTETDHAFRSSNIPPGIEIKYWTTQDDLSENHRKIVENFRFDGGFWKAPEIERAALLDSPKNEFHGKFKFLKEILDTFLRMDKSVKGIILTRNEANRLEVEKYLALNFAQISNSKQVLAMTSKKLMEIVDFSNVTFIICMDRESIFNVKRYQGAYLAILHRDFEKLRREDGRIIVEDFKSTASSSSKPQKVGALERYEFKFEKSRLKINALKMPVEYFLPTSSSSSEKPSSSTNQISKNHPKNPESNTTILMSTKEHQELISRIKNIDFSKYRQKNRRMIFGEMNEDLICWNQDAQYLGDLKSSKKTLKMVEYLRNEKVERSCKVKQLFEYTNEISNPRHISNLDKLLQKIDQLLLPK